MARAAGSSHTYTWKLKGVRKGEEYTIDLPSVTHIIKSVKDALGFGGMAWWGYKIGIRALNPELEDDDIDELYEAAKQTDYTPNKVRDEAGERGTGAHDLLEAAADNTIAVYVNEKGVIIVAGEPEVLADIIFDKDESKLKKKFIAKGTKTFEPVGHQLGGARWWTDNEPAIAFAERPVWSLRYGFQGTLDAARGVEVPEPSPWGPWLEVIDYKSHKPASGARKDGSYREGEGPAYMDDLLQVDGYAIAVEELGLGTVVGTRVVLVAEDGTYWEDARRVTPGSFLKIKALHDEICRKPECRLLARAYGR